MNGTLNNSPGGDNLARDGLKTVLQRHGRALLADPRRCEALLADTCPGEKRATAVLTYVLKEGIPQRLLQVPAASLSQSTIDQLAQKLVQQGAFPMPVEAWRWGIGSWAEALGLHVGAPQGGEVRNRPPPQVPAAGADHAPTGDSSSLATIVIFWRPILSMNEARGIVGIGMLINAYLMATVVGLSLRSSDRFGLLSSLIAIATFIANLGTIRLPALGYVTFALGTANCVLLLAVAGSASTPGIIIALIALVWLSYMGTLRAARFLSSPVTNTLAKRG